VDSLPRQAQDGHKDEDGNKVDLEGDEPITIDNCFLRTQARRCSLPFAMAGKKNGPLISPLCVLRKTDQFTKTGSGQTKESLRNEISCVFFQQSIRCADQNAQQPPPERIHDHTRRGGQVRCVCRGDGRGAKTGWPRFYFSNENRFYLRFVFGSQTNRFPFCPFARLFFVPSMYW
jgi:hypothetical protein